MKNYRSGICRSLAAALLVVLTMSATYADNTGDSTQNEIKSVIAGIYDQPDLKVDIAPVVTADGYAIADWIQGSKGGRALLRQDNGKWKIVACGGSAFKDVDLLSDAGMSKNTARQLVAKLKQAEKSISKARIKMFDSFGATVDMSGESHHSHTSH